MDIDEFIVREGSDGWEIVDESLNVEPTTSAAPQMLWAIHIWTSSPGSDGATPLEIPR